MAPAISGLFVVRITALKDSESKERVALYLSGRLRDKTVDEIRGFLDHLPIVITRKASAELAGRIQRELTDLGAIVELTPVEGGTAAPLHGPPPIIPGPPFSPPLPTFTPSPSAGPGPAWTAPTPASPAAGIPWDFRKETGLFKAWWDTLFQSLRWPNEFCARMPTGGGYFEPLFYGVLTTMIGLIGGMVWQIPFQLLPLAMSHGITGKIGAGIGITFIIVGIFLVLIFAPFVLAALEFVYALFAHVFVLLVGGRGGFEATFRVNCFSNSCQVFQVIPGLGGLISMVYWCVLVYFGYRHAHRLDKTPAFVAMILPMVVGLVIIVIIIVAIVVGVIGSLKGLDIDKFIPK